MDDPTVTDMMLFAVILFIAGIALIALVMWARTEKELSKWKPVRGQNGKFVKIR